MQRDDFGDPGAVTCRWCGEGKRRRVGVLVCPACDLIAKPADTISE